MISRYQRQVMKDLWSDQYKFEQYLKVELASSYAWMKLGLFDQSTYDKLEKASFSLADIESIEKETKHDVIAFTRAVSLSLGDEKKFFHYGLTSTDVVDSAQSLILKEANRIILEGIDQFMETLKKKAYQYMMTPAMGRTHGIHAEVTSFGLKFALWYQDFKRIKSQFLLAARQVSCVKLSGAVGNYSASTPEIQRMAAEVLGLDESEISTQTLQRDRHAFYMSQLALIGTELEKIAVEIRHLSRTEVREVQEYFSSGQKGSSAMPHKKNPISSENITGLSRVLRGYMLSSYENIALWHERDISHSSVERIILADATTLVDYMLNRYNQTIEHLVVNPSQMLKNIEITQGVIFAQSALHLLIDKGLVREKAYDLVQGLAMKALNESIHFKTLISQEEAVTSLLTSDEIDYIFNLEKHLKYVEHIYQKVFN